MVNVGVTSVTFRKTDPLHIIQLTKNVGLQSIEWGADVHVPPGNLENALRIFDKTREAGLKVAGYGSYFAAGKQESAEFKEILRTAVALNAPIIRVWAGWEASATAEPSYVRRVIECTRSICDMASEQGILIGYEYHSGTLTDNALSALNVLHEINRDNMRLYWQLDSQLSYVENCAALQAVLPYLYNVHVFYLDSAKKRLPLKQGEKDWQGYAQLLKNCEKVSDVMLEFVRDNSEEQFAQDASTLKELFGFVL